MQRSDVYKLIHAAERQEAFEENAFQGYNPYEERQRRREEIKLKKQQAANRSNAKKIARQNAEKKARAEAERENEERQRLEDAKKANPTEAAVPDEWDDPVDGLEFCLICHNDERTFETLVKLPCCPRKYHATCVDMMVSAGKGSCPICKLSFIPVRS